jgi:hypothetical protein
MLAARTGFTEAHPTQLSRTVPSEATTQEELTMPDLRAIFTNLKAPMPLRHKMLRILVNNWTKLRTRSACCGHLGEPGC